MNNGVWFPNGYSINAETMGGTKQNRVLTLYPHNTIVFVLPVQYNFYVTVFLQKCLSERLTHEQPTKLSEEVKTKD